jgi:hypothetical protein
MGEGIAGHIFKGPVHQLVDSIVNDSAKKAAFLDALENAVPTAKDYVDLLTKKYGLPTATADYLTQWWYNEGREGFWSWMQPIYPIVRRGLIKAIRETMAGAANLPLDSYWSSEGTQVETFVLRSPVQVTRIILTPPTPPPEKERKTDKDWFVVRRGSSSLKKGDFSNLKVKDQIVDDKHDGNVITWRIRDF